MITQIPFKGFSSVPSDGIAPDGDLAHAQNVINRYGYLIPRPQPYPEFFFITNSHIVDARIVAVHKSLANTRYIVERAINENTGTKSYKYFWFDPSEYIAYGDTDYVLPTVYKSGISGLRGYINVDSDHPTPLEPETDDETPSETETPSQPIDVLAGDIYPFEVCGGMNMLVLHELDLPEGMHFSGFKSLGNMLMAFSDDNEIYYTLWYLGEYKVIGTQIPSFDINFKILGIGVNDIYENEVRFSFDTEGSIYKDNSYAATYLDNLKSSGISQFEEYEHECWEKNYFCQPFLVRYAIRLFDGSYVRVSPPVLMAADALRHCYFKVKNEENKDALGLSVESTTTTVKFALPYFALGWQSKYIYGSNGFSITNITEDEKELLKLWAEVIDGIDIFITPPIYFFRKKLLTYYGNDPDATGLDSTDTDGYTTMYYFPAADLHRAVANMKNFYKIYSLALDKENLYFDGAPVYSGSNETTSFNLVNLTTNPTLEESVIHSDDIISGGCSFVYNNRLTLGNITRKLFSGFSPLLLDDYTPNAYSSSLICFKTIEWGAKHIINGKEYYTHHDPVDINLDRQHGILFDWAAKDRHVICVRNRTSLLFYPDSNVREMYITMVTDDQNGPLRITAIFPMKAHQFLNGSYWFNVRGSSPTAPVKFIVEQITTDTNTTNTTTGTTNTKDNPYAVKYTIGEETWMAVNGYEGTFVYNSLSEPVNEPNKIYISAAENPLVFPSATTIGNGTVIGFSTVVKALSQGQFGQFPLYAFSTEGVWALELDSTGTYTSKHPVSRDVCLYPEAILQTDNSVIFPASRGIMRLSGSDTTCISSKIDPYYSFNSYVDLPFLDEIWFQKGTFNSAYCPSANLSLRLSDFLNNSGMAYDYSGQLIYLFNSTANNCLIYSLDSDTWSSMHVNFSRVVNDYPDTYFMSKKRDFENTGNYISFFFRLSRPVFASLPVAVVTRPLTLDDPDSPKTVNSVIIRGVFRDGHVKSALWGCNNLFSGKWHLIASSTNHRIRNIAGSPYRYFRVGIFGSLDPDESVHAISVEYTPRLRNRLRY